MTGASTWSLQESDFYQIRACLNELLKEASARCALLVDRAGQLLVHAGEELSFDPAAFASLTAADFSANDQLAKMIGEEEFASLFHRGDKESMYLADIAHRVILVVLFDQRTTVGMVRLKVKQAVGDLTNIFDEMFARAEIASGAGQARGLLDGADDEIDQLFGD